MFSAFIIISYNKNKVFLFHFCIFVYLDASLKFFCLRLFHVLIFSILILSIFISFLFLCIYLFILYFLFQKDFS